MNASPQQQSDTSVMQAAPWPPKAAVEPVRPELTDDQLTEIYKSANNIGEGKNPPISTKFIFAAMRAAYKLGKTGS